MAEVVLALTVIALVLSICSLFAAGLWLGAYWVAARLDIFGRRK